MGFGSSTLTSVVAKVGILVVPRSFLVVFGIPISLELRPPIDGHSQHYAPQSYVRS